MRLIDADELLKWISGQSKSPSCPKNESAFGLRIMKHIDRMLSAQPEPISDVYMRAVWTWLLDYQIKAAELKGRYTPYEVLSWVVNDWRKEHE